jgi:putative transcriptional regulator
LSGILDIIKTLCYTVSNMNTEKLTQKYTLKNRLRVARAEKDISQEELARSVGVTRQTISSVETGEYCPSVKLALALALKLDKKVEEIFILEEENV